MKLRTIWRYDVRSLGNTTIHIQNYRLAKLNCKQLYVFSLNVFVSTEFDT